MSRRMVFGRYDFAAFGSYASYAAGSVVLPIVLVALAADLGFPLDEGGMAQGGSLQATRSISVVIATLACGFVAGRWGFRRSLGVSLAFISLMVMAAAMAPSFGFLLLAVTLAGLGEGIVEGLGTPLVQQLHPKESGRYINFAHAFWSVGVLLTFIIGGWLLSKGVSWRVLIGVAGALGLVPAVLFLAPSRKVLPQIESAVAQSWRDIVARSTDILRRPRFWVFFAAMFMAGGGELGLTFWTASYIQLEIAREPWMGGVGTAFFAGGMITGRIGWGYLIVQHRLLRLIVGSALLGAVLSLLIPNLGSLGWLFFVLLLAGITVGPFWPSIQSYAVDRLPVDSTMLFVLLSCAGIPGCGFFIWLMGLIGDRWGLRAAFFVIPACFALIAALLLAERYLGCKATPPVPGPAAND